MFYQYIIIVLHLSFKFIIPKNGFLIDYPDIIFFEGSHKTWFFCSLIVLILTVISGFMV